MTREQVRVDFINVIQPFIRRDVMQELDDSMTLVEDLRVNSARMVDIILDSEEKFKIAISDEEAGQLTTIGSAVDLIYLKTSREGSSV